MPVSIQNYTRKPLRGDPIHLELSRLPTGFLSKECFARDTNGDRYVYAGLIVAEVNGGLYEGEITGSQPYYVPYSATAAYGTGSDTAVGILAEPHDETLTDWQIAPVDRGTAYEARCYVDPDVVGTVPAAVKTSLSDIKWR
jgi:hypothetical protein